MDLSREIVFKTTRSGGKGGQNVNKVETAVIASFHVNNSLLLSEEQKSVIRQKLAKKITSDGYLQVKSQVFRTQLENKTDASRKINIIIANAPHKKRHALLQKFPRDPLKTGSILKKDRPC